MSKDEKKLLEGMREYKRKLLPELFSSNPTESKDHGPSQRYKNQRNLNIETSPAYTGAYKNRDIETLHNSLTSSNMRIASPTDMFKVSMFP